MKTLPWRDGRNTINCQMLLTWFRQHMFNFYNWPWETDYRYMPITRSTNKDDQDKYRVKDA